MRCASLLVGSVLAVVVGGACERPPAVGKDRTGTSTTPNAVARVDCGGRFVVAVAASGGARLNVFDDALDPAGSDVAFEDGAAPWDVVDIGGGRVAVSLFGAHDVATVDVCGDAGIVSRASSTESVAVTPAITPRGAFDNDLDGDTDGVVESMKLHAPEGVAFVDVDAGSDGGFVFVAFTNLIDPAIGDDEMQAGPGVVARFAVDGAGQLSFVDQRTLACQNPQGVATGVIDGAAVVVVSCTGRFQNGGDGRFVRASPGGLAVFDAASFALLVEDTFDQSFGTPAVVDGEIVVGSVLGGSIFRFDRDLTLIEDRAIGGVDESLFQVLTVEGELAVTRFVGGDLVLDPFGSARTVRFTDPTEPPRGLIDVVAVDPEGVDDVDDNDDVAFGALSLSGELVRVDLP